MQSRTLLRQWRRPIRFVAMVAALGMVVLTLPMAVNAAASDESTIYFSVNPQSQVAGADRTFGVDVTELSCETSGSGQQLGAATIDYYWGDSSSPFDAMETDQLSANRVLTVPHGVTPGTYSVSIWATSVDSDSPCFSRQTIKTIEVEVEAIGSQTDVFLVDEDMQPLVSNTTVFGDAVSVVAGVQANGANVTTGSVEFQIGNDVPISVPVGNGPGGTTILRLWPAATGSDIGPHWWSGVIGEHGIKATYVDDTIDTSTDTVIWRVTKKTPTISIDPTSFTATANSTQAGSVDGTVTVESGVDGYNPSGSVTVQIPDVADQTIHFDDAYNGNYGFSLNVPAGTSYGDYTLSYSYSDDPNLSDASGTAPVVISLAPPPPVPVYFNNQSLTYGTVHSLTVGSTSSPQTEQGQRVQLWDVTDPNNPVALPGIGVFDQFGNATIPVEVTSPAGYRTFQPWTVDINGVPTGAGQARSSIRVFSAPTVVEIDTDDLPTAGKATDVTATVKMRFNPLPVASGTGTVQFSRDGSDLGSPITVGTGGTATLPDQVFAAGTFGLTARFTATDANYQNGTSDYYPEVENSTLTPVSVTIDPTPATVTNLAVVPSSPSAAGQAITVTADIGPVLEPGGPTAHAAITVNDERLDETAGVIDGTVTFDGLQLEPGPNTIQVEYLGDDYRAVGQATITHIVNSWTSTTALSSDPDLTSVIEAGDEVTFTATVTGQDGSDTPRGQVEFYRVGDDDDAILLGTENLDDDGQAVLTTRTIPLLPAGERSVYARYTGQGIVMSGSTSSTVPLSIVRAASTTEITSVTPGSPSAAGTPITVTASIGRTVDGHTADGTATIAYGDTDQATVDVEDGVATFTDIAPPGPGTHTIRVTYDGGTNRTSSSDTRDQWVGKWTPTVSIAADPTSFELGGSSTITATIGAPDGAGDPSGVVTFYRDSATGTRLGSRMVLNRQATLELEDVGADTYEIIAVYSGDDDFAYTASTSTPVTVEKGTPVITPDEPVYSGEYGSVLSGGFTVAPSNDRQTIFPITGTVEVMIGDDVVDTVELDTEDEGAGTFTFDTSAVDALTGDISFQYSGNADWNSNSTSAEFELTAADTTIAVTDMDSTAAYGDTVTGTVTVSSSLDATPTGTVTVQMGEVIFDDVELDDGVAQFQILTTLVQSGERTIEFSYSGDDNYTPNQTTKPLTIDPAVSTVTMIDPPTESVYGTGFNINIGTSITPDISMPGDATVTIYDVTDSEQPIQLSDPTTLSNGSIEVEASPVYAGERTIEARTQTGTDNIVGATSAPHVITIERAQPTVYFMLLGPDSPSGPEETLTAQVAVEGTSNRAQPDGTVTLSYVSTAEGDDPVSVEVAEATIGHGGVATFTGIAPPPPGEYTFVGTYSGSDRWLPGHSDQGHDVVQWESELALEVPADPVAYGQDIVMTATMSSTGESAPDPSGVVEFHLGDFDGEVVATAPFDGRTAVGTVNNLDVGPHSIVATWSGDSNFAAPESVTHDVEVTQTEATIEVWVTPTPIVLGQPAMLHAEVSLAGSPSGSSARSSSSRSSVASVSTVSPFGSARSLPTARSIGALGGASVLGVSASAAPVATGMVDFLINDVVVGSAPLIDGVATLPWVFNSLGAVRVSASYNGSPNVAGTADAALTTIEVERPAAPVVPVAPSGPSATPASSESGSGQSAGTAAGTSGGTSGSGSNAAGRTPLALTGGSPMSLLLLGAFLVVGGIAATFTARSRRRAT